MLISETHNLILMLPQKCGSSTLETRLHCIQTNLKNFKREQTKHITLRQAQELDIFSQYPSYLTACFVRNPYDRVYSWFQTVKTANTGRKSEERPRELKAKIANGVDVSFNKRRLRARETNMRLLEESNYDFNDFYKANPQRFNPATNFTHLGGHQLVKFIGTVENFEDDFSELCRRINLITASKENANVANPNTAILRNKNKPLYLEKYSLENIERLNNYMADDFTFLGYDSIKPNSL